MTQEARIYNGEKTVSAISGAGKIGQEHVKVEREREQRERTERPEREREREKERERWRDGEDRKSVV